MSTAGFNQFGKRTANAHLGIHPFTHLSIGHKFLEPLQPIGTNRGLIGGQRIFELMHQKLVHHVHDGDGSTVEGSAVHRLPQRTAAGHGKVDGGDDVVKLFHGVCEQVKFISP